MGVVTFCRDTDITGVRHLHFQCMVHGRLNSCQLDMATSPKNAVLTEKDCPLSTEQNGNIAVRVLDDGLGPSWMVWRRRRYLVALLAFFGFMNVYSLRVNLSVAIVAMTNNYTVTLSNGTQVQQRDFDWDSKQTGLALSAFFYGYIVTQLPGGWLANLWGGARVYCAGVAATALLTIVTPPATKISFSLLIFIRIIEGLFEGVTFPCIHSVWSRWAPPLERSKLAAIGFSGSFFGTVISMPLSGYIAETLGWEAVFYFFGVTGCIWCIVWSIVVKEAPRYDPNISKQELAYIEESIGNQPDQKVVIPWMSILTSAPVWAIVVAHTTENWGFYTLLTQLPTFMHDTLNFQLVKGGFMSGLPYLVMSCVLLSAGQLADYLRAKKIMSTTAVRKTFNCSAFLAQTVFMMLAGYLASPTSIIACLVIAVGFGGFAWTGFAVNHLDIAPQHASVLMGLGNTFATLPGIMSPLVTGFIVQNHSADEWQIVFYIASSIYLIGAIFYGVFASGELQPWAETKVPPSSVAAANGHENKAMEMDTSP